MTYRFSERIKGLGKLLKHNASNEIVTRQIRANLLKINSGMDRDME